MLRKSNYAVVAELRQYVWAELRHCVAVSLHISYLGSSDTEYTQACLFGMDSTMLDETITYMKMISELLFLIRSTSVS